MDTSTTSTAGTVWTSQTAEDGAAESTVIFGVLKTGGVSIDRALASEEATHHPMPETGWSRPAETRLWVPVSAYLLTHPEGTVLSTLVGSVRSEQTPRATSGGSSPHSTRLVSHQRRLSTNTSQPEGSLRPSSWLSPVLLRLFNRSGVSAHGQPGIGDYAVAWKRRYMESARSKLAGGPYLVAGGTYLLLHLSLLFGLAWLFEGNPGSLVATGVPSLAYYLLITIFGGVVVALSLQRVGGYLRLVSLVVLLGLLGSRFVLGSVPYMQLPTHPAAAVCTRRRTARSVQRALSHGREDPPMNCLHVSETG